MAFDPLQLAAELESSLWNHLIRPWFPACVDPNGGFYQNFSRDWRLDDDGLKGIVFQSRMTWVTATLGEADHPRSDEFRGNALSGAKFIADHMLTDEGAPIWTVERDTRRDGYAPAGEHAQQHHSYGAAFAIYGLAATYRACADPFALDAAKRIFYWLEANTRDEEHGGYFECTDLDGRPLLMTPSGIRKGKDAIGTVYGLKSQNTHLHLLEAFTELFGVWPDPLLRTRLEEVWEILTYALLSPEGWLHLYARPDWTSVPGEVSYGHDIEAAHLLMDASIALNGQIDTTTDCRARKLIEHTLHEGWDSEFGGFFNTGTPHGVPVDREKIWWVQAEGLLGLIRGLELPDADIGRLQMAIGETWKWIREKQIDREYGGWFGYLTPSGEPISKAGKGDMWKAAYHDGRALLFAARALRGQAPPQSNLLLS